jgi:multisubunit Na+/H+ antiporter MnhC subunit
MDANALELSEITLRVIGGFYAFAGYVATRAALTAHVIDQAISALAARTTSALERAQSVWLLSAAILILAGGVALMLLLDIAAWLFVLSALGQAAYLFFVAPRYFDVEDPPDAKGRQQSTNAFVLYAAATAYVLWAALTDRLVGLREIPWLLPVAAGAAVSAYALYAIWMYARPLQRRQ